jgi:multiple sugar transport system ATP-binding protein
MSFGLRLRKVPKNEIDEKVKRTAELLGIRELLDRKPKELSGGQRQRVALGRAIVRSPKVFLFDEPLSNLDAKLRIAMRAELLDLHARLKTTTIYVTHDQLEAMTMASRIVVMNEGLIQQVDAPQIVYDHPLNRYVAGFIGSPSMNFLDCTLVKENGNVYAQTKGIKLRLPQDKAKRVEPYIGKQAIFGMRPEHIFSPETEKVALPESTFQADVWVVEPLGSAKLLHVRNEDETIVCQVDPRVQMSMGDKVELGVNLELAHIFDRETEKAVF